MGSMHVLIMMKVGSNLIFNRTHLKLKNLEVTTQAAFIDMKVQQKNS